MHNDPPRLAPTPNKQTTARCRKCKPCTTTVHDCGHCLNCADKIKFGGPGVRKQTCETKRCLLRSAPHANPKKPRLRYADARNEAPDLAAAATSHPSVPPAAPHAATSQLMDRMKDLIPESEWDGFWEAVHCCVRLQQSGQPPHDSPSQRPAKRPRIWRCGHCYGCTRGDCGECKNCRDKPRFGGPGVKKQACLERACLDPTVDHDGGASSGFFSNDASPALCASEPASGHLAALESASLSLARAAAPPPPVTPPVPPTLPTKLDAAASMMLATRRRLDELRAARLGRPLPLATYECTGYSTAEDEPDKPANASSPPGDVAPASDAAGGSFGVSLLVSASGCDLRQQRHGAPPQDDALAVAGGGSSGNSLLVGIIGGMQQQRCGAPPLCFFTSSAPPTC